jgi:hypothetical protein
MSASNAITTTTGSRTVRRVGAMFGRKVGIGVSWVNDMIILSTTRSVPTVRRTGMILGMVRPVPDDVLAVEVRNRFGADAAHRRRHMVDEGLGGHRRHGRGEILGAEFVEDVLIEHRAEVMDTVAHPARSFPPEGRTSAAVAGCNHVPAVKIRGSL